MRFSVVIPSFGQAKYLRNAITSAISQNYPGKYEIIVVDDGSTDGSLEIAHDYVPRIRVIRQINKGLAAARNAGIMNAVGEYVFFLDADDMMLPECLSMINKEINLFAPDVVAPSIRCFDEKTVSIQDTILMQNPTLKDFKEGNRLAYCSAIKRSTLLEVGGYSTRYDTLGGWEDLALWYDLLTRDKRIRTIPTPLVMYRLKENSMWKEAEKNKVALWAQLVKDFPNVKDHVKS